MTYAAARSDIATMVKAIQTAWVAYSLNIETDNRNSINFATQVKPFLQVDTYYLTGDQMDMADVPKVRQYGQILLSAVTKDGAGTTEGLALLDFVVPYFERKDLTCIRTGVAEPQKTRLFQGWFYQPVLFNFYFDR